jgi:hypothetical protein
VIQRQRTHPPGDIQNAGLNGKTYGQERRIMTSTRYAEGRRAVVIHEDDVGMTHGANTAFAELSAMGTCSAGSLMAPCPWFPEAIEMALRNRTLDLGVHLTLNSEKKPYRWRPLTSPPKSAGLTDEAGYFWPDVPSTRKNAAPEAVEAELRAQIDAVLATGIDVIETPWRRKTDAETAYRQVFADIPEGLTYLSMHFNAPGDFEVVEPGQAHIRTEEYAVFKSGVIDELVAAHGVEVVGMRQIRDRLRAAGRAR